MAITYLRATGTEEGNLELGSEGIGFKGFVRVWNAGTNTPTTKWIVIGGDDKRAGGALTEIPTAVRSAVIAAVADDLSRFKVDLSKYGPGTNRVFRTELGLAASIVEVL